jgi:hypothetical protein
MSKLNFTPVDKAFILGSSQIKDTQEEIAQLTKLILESNNMNDKKPKQKNLAPPEQAYGNFETPVPATKEQPTPFYNQGAVQNYMRVGYPDQQTAIFQQRMPQDDIDYNLMKVIGHPKFDDIVKNYALIKHPEWLYKESVYTPVPPVPPIQTPYSSPYSIKSSFGANYQTTVCFNVKNYVIFFVVCVIIFVLLSLYFD